MRPTLRVLALLTALLLVGAPLASAQPPFSFGTFAQGIAQYSTASISAVNTTAPVALWSSTIPGPFTATSANSNWTPSSVATPPPMHLVLQGNLTTNVASASVGPVNIGVNFGGGVTGVASLALANASVFDRNLATVPMQLDVWFAPVATATATSLPGGGACFFHMSARLTIATASTTGVLAGASPTILDAQACGTVGGGFLASAEQLNVLWQWGSASLTNSATIYRGTLLYGN
jgi:hypothetical protein